MGIKIGDFFAGIGGFHQAIKNLREVECLITCEIDKNAQLTYNLNHKTQIFENDIQDVKNIPKLDILFGGFPCQAFSVAGYQKGFNDNRGSIVFNLIDIININKPKVIFLENVKNFYSHNDGKTFKTIINKLNTYYNIYTNILNTIDFGIPQNRERIYIVGFLKDIKNKFSFPKDKIKKSNITDILEKEKVDDIYYYNNKLLWEKIKDYPFKKGIVYQWRRHYIRENKNFVFPTLTANMGTGGHNIPIIKDAFGIRKITPKECMRLQGFNDNFLFPDIANSHKYKQIGNSITIPVVEKILNNVLEYL